MKTYFRRLMRPFLERQVQRLIARKRLKVVAVVGAVGKTSTKQAVATVLAQKYRVLVHPGNFNAEIGLPLAVFELDVPSPIINPLAWLWRLWRMEQAIHGSYPYDLLVLELGTDHPGEIPHFMTYLKPDLGIVTAIAPEHMEHFADIDAVAAEEFAVAASSKQLLVNRDDTTVEQRRSYVDRHPHHATYGLGREAMYSFKVTTATLTDGTQGVMRHGDEKAELSAGVYGPAAAKIVAAAYAAGNLMGLSATQLGKGVAATRPVSGRMNPLPGASETIIIDDTYNSSPEAVLSALAALAAAPAKRRIAILGSMNELGAESPRYHQEVGAAAAGVDWLITIGEQANRYLGSAAVAAGLDPSRFKPADSPYAAGEFVRLMLTPGDVVLVKGSQNGVFAEEAAKMLLADPADAAKLVRQSPAWLARKAKQFKV